MPSRGGLGDLENTTAELNAGLTYLLLRATSDVRGVPMRRASSFSRWLFGKPRPSGEYGVHTPAKK